VSTISRIIEKHWWVIYLVVFVLGLFWLSVTPVVNNDEFWFGDAAKQIAEGTGYDVKIYPELYQGIKANKLIGFSMLQAIAIQLLGFNLFALRIVSYLCVFIAGWMFFLLAKQKEFNKAHLIPFVLVLNPYVWHVGHVGRPEAVLLLLGICATYLLARPDMNVFNILILAILSCVSYIVFILGLYIGVFVFVVLLYKTSIKKNTSKNVILFVIFSALITLLFLATQGINNLYSTYTGIELKASNLFGSFKSAFTFYVQALLINKMAYPTLLFLVVFLILIWRRRNNVRDSFVADVEIYIHLFICLLFFLYLRRTNMFYTSLIILGIHQLILTVRGHQRLKHSVLIAAIILNISFVVFYTLIFPSPDKIKFRFDLKSEKVMAPVQFRSQLLSADSFIAMEDYKGVLKVNYMPYESYVKRQKVKYVLMDEFTQSQWYGSEIIEYLNKNATAIDSGRTQSLGSRDYEDIPYYLSIRKAYKIVKTKPQHEWKLYQIN